MDEIRTSKGGCEEILLSTNNKYENLFEVYAEVKYNPVYFKIIQLSSILII